jgi:diguanylate cyclase (GGDEF)-like protein
MGAYPTPEASPLERLLQRLRPHRARRLSPRERRTELASALLLGLVVAAMAVLLPSAHGVSAIDLIGLIALHGFCSHVRLYIGGGSAVPTQLALIPMLFLLPPALVPVAVAAGLWCSTVADIALGTAGPERLVSSIGDAWHAVGPALVFAAAGSPEPEVTQWLLLAPALLAEAAFDTLSSMLREWTGRGIPPSLQLQVMGRVYAVDAMLTPLGFMAVLAPIAGHRGWLLLAPLCIVLYALVADRRVRIETEHARVEDLHRERARLQAVMRSVGDTLTANLDRDAMLDAILQTARQAMGATHGWAGTPGPLFDDGAPRAHHALQTAARRSLQTGETVTTCTGDWHAVARRIGRGERREALMLARRHEPFSTDEIEILEHLVAHAAISLENTELHARLREQATTDALTGLANHRALMTALNGRLDGMSLILFDLDDFKNVNDTWGHLAGDQVLRAVAAAVRSRCRGVDVTARYGGEELAVALPRTDLAGAQLVAEDIRHTIAALEIGAGIRVTVSAGVAAAHPDDSATDLIAAADAALYEAKHAGKNCTMVAREPAISGR